MNRKLVLPGLWIGTILVVAVAAPVLGLPDPVKQDIARRLAGPMLGSPLGRDEFGRDVLSRLIWGARTSLAVAFASAFVAAVIGTTLGMIGAWKRGWVEWMSVRSMDVVLCFPPILLALLVVTLLGPGAGTLILVLSILYVPGFVRVAYGEVLSLRANDYVEAVRALGAPTSRILVRTVLPNIAGPLLVQVSLCVAAAIVLESGLSFLGLGVVPPSPSWGLMIRGARTTMAQAPWLLLWPCGALTLTILGMNLFCDRLRDLVDPRTTSGQAKPRMLDRLLPGFLPAGHPAHDAVLAVDGLTVSIATPRGLVTPVEGVGFHVGEGETLAIVGESGSGKSLTATAILGLLPPIARATQGTARFAGRDLLLLEEEDRRRLRGGELAMIFQDPMSSLNPVYRVGDQIVEAIRAHGSVSDQAARARALALFRKVGIADPERRLDAFPHEMSGGMRQRVMIAMAIANNPRVLIADEPTTALDVTVQAQILTLLKDLQRENGMALVFITHSLSVVAEIADRVCVMYAGQVVEDGPVGAVFHRPRHPYTRALLAATPEGEELPTGIGGVVPLPQDFPTGCRFAERCGFAIDACRAGPVTLRDVEDGRRARCIRSDDMARLPEAVA